MFQGVVLKMGHYKYGLNNIGRFGRITKTPNDAVLGKQVSGLWTLDEKKYVSSTLLMKRSLRDTRYIIE